ncbi:MAG: mechanosensitive ion channel [Candidatus Altiarchaeota archaeon]
MAESKILIGNVTIENFLLFLFTFIITLIFGNLVNFLARRFFDERISIRNSKIVARILQYFFIFAGLYYGIYYELGLDLTALVASLGIIGIAIAFSSQQIIQNVIAGILISFQGQIQIEDWVKVGGVPDTGIGRVKDITLTSTTIRDMDGKLVYIPNSALLSSKIINYTKAGFTEVPIQIKIPYTPEYGKVREIILEVANENRSILSTTTKKGKSSIERILQLPHIKKIFADKPLNMEIFKPRVLISEISDSKITFSVRFWILEIHKKDEIISEFLSALLERFKKEGVKV